MDFGVLCIFAILQSENLIIDIGMSKFRFMALQELAEHRPLEVEKTAGEMADYYGCHVFNRKNMLRYLPLIAVEAIDSAIF